MDSHRRSKFADLRDPNVRAVKVHATTLHAFTPELEAFARAGQAAAALRTLGVMVREDETLTPLMLPVDDGLLLALRSC